MKKRKGGFVVDNDALARCLLQKFENQQEHNKKKELRKKAQGALKSNPRTPRVIILLIALSFITSCGGLSIKTGEAIRQEGILLNGAIQTAKDSADVEGAYWKGQKSEHKLRAMKFRVLRKEL